MTNHFLGQVTQKAILHYPQGYVIVKEKNQDAWILPGGRLDAGEEPEAGLLREIKEEMGISDCTVERLVSVAVYHAKHPDEVSKLFVFYVVTAIGDEEITINNEIEDVHFISTKEDLVSYPMNENQRMVLEQFLN